MIEISDFFSIYYEPIYVLMLNMFEISIVLPFIRILVYANSTIR